MRVLSLNLCVTWTSSRRERLDKVVQFCKDNEVDVLLVQEGVRCCYFYDTIRYLANQLGFDHCSRANLYPFFWEFRIGIVSRYEILEVDSANWPVPKDKRWPDNIWFPWQRRAVAAMVSVPGFGLTSLVSLHFPGMDQAGKDALFQDFKKWLCSLPEADARVIGGDFNCPSSNKAFVDALGVDNIFGVSPDYLIAQGVRLFGGEKVLTDGVTDHAGGVVAEVER